MIQRFLSHAVFFEGPFNYVLGFSEKLEQPPFRELDHLILRSPSSIFRVLMGLRRDILLDVECLDSWETDLLKIELRPS